MILIDPGPLVALVDADDQYHEKCVDWLKSLQEPLVTVWPLLFEAVYLLGDLPQAQEALWEMLARGAVRLLTLDLIDIPRMRELMIKYADRPMDVADAALVRVAEREGIRRIFTVDQRFHGLSPSRTDRPCNRPIGELRNNTDPLKSPPTDRRLRE